MSSWINVLETFVALACSAVAIRAGRHATRLAAELHLRVSQLSGVEISPLCRKCKGPLQAAREPHNGQTHFCPTCQLWAVVVQPPRPREGS